MTKNAREKRTAPIKKFFAAKSNPCDKKIWTERQRLREKYFLQNVMMTFVDLTLFRASSWWRSLSKCFFAIRHGDDCCPNTFSRFVTVTIADITHFLRSFTWHFFDIRQNDDFCPNAFSWFVICRLTRYSISSAVNFLKSPLPKSAGRARPANFILLRFLTSFPSARKILLTSWNFPSHNEISHSVSLRHEIFAPPLFCSTDFF